MNKISYTSLFNISGNIFCRIENADLRKVPQKKKQKIVKYNSKVDVRIYLASVFITKKHNTFY